VCLQYLDQLFNFWEVRWNIWKSRECYFFNHLKQKIFNCVYSSRSACNVSTSRYFREIHGSHNLMKKPRSWKKEQNWSSWQRKPRHTVMTTERTRLKSRGKRMNRKSDRTVFNRMTFMRKLRKFSQCRTTIFLSAILFVLRTTSMLNRVLHRSRNNARIFVAEYDVNMKIVVLRHNREKERISYVIFCRIFTWIIEHFHHLRFSNKSKK